MNLKTALRTVIPPELEHELKRSFDTIGNIAILEISPLLRPHQTKIAKALMVTTPSITTVLKKAGEFEGEFRTRKLTYIGGKRTKEAVYMEHGCRFLLDVEKVYFSPRLSTERKRIFEQVKPTEEVLVMFSGCGPYVCTIAKNAKPQSVVGVELNPVGHRYALENIRKNKLQHASCYEGDVRVVVPLLHRTFDRIIMPLPKDAGEFLDIAFTAAKKGTIIHLYDFCHEDDFPAETHTMIKRACDLHGVAYRIIASVKCGQYGIRKYRVCVDFQLLSSPKRNTLQEH
ncbi:class I SAM-dependent methyltransferase family protein [Candidatus Woesearchaeota archaeon]|nr:class I SAM-dependent methyltransferase family protein [Candidatus Woesearchaeota archaeon]